MVAARAQWLWAMKDLPSPAGPGPMFLALQDRFSAPGPQGSPVRRFMLANVDITSSGRSKRANTGRKRNRLKGETKQKYYTEMKAFW